MSASPAIGVIVLAAGGSTRMGSPKQLLSFRERSLLRHAAATAIESGCSPVVVVLGAHARRMKSEVAEMPALVVTNARWREGMGTSIRAGMLKLSAARVELQAVVLMLCDQPLVSAPLIRRLVRAYVAQRSKIVVAEYGGTLGVPALFDHTLFIELLQLAPTEGAKRVLMEHAAEAFRIRSPEALLDIDTIEDYRYLQELSTVGRA